MDTQFQSLNVTSGGQLEQPRVQENFQLQVEDHSISAEKILSEQKIQEGGAILFIP